MENCECMGHEVEYVSTSMLCKHKTLPPAVVWAANITLTSSSMLTGPCIVKKFGSSENFFYGIFSLTPTLLRVTNNMLFIKHLWLYDPAECA